MCANGLLMLRAGSGIFGASLSTTKSVWNQVHRSCTLKGGRLNSKCATELWLRRATSPQSTTAIFTRHSCYCHYCTLADVLGPHSTKNRMFFEIKPVNAVIFATHTNLSECLSSIQVIGERVAQKGKTRHVRLASSRREASAPTIRLHRYSHSTSCDTPTYAPAPEPVMSLSPRSSFVRLRSHFLHR
jgi:hypothetical protein